jgi:prepilin-type N-terminal cleavage/methylation domain-containing protein
MNEYSAPKPPDVPPRRPRHGLTIMEVVTVLAIIGVLLSMAAPSFSRTMEQAHADLAGANLQSIWTAQRYYWLENRTYAPDLLTLEAIDLLDSAIVDGSLRYQFAVTAADAASFTATATRTGSTRWTGGFTIDETGTMSGEVQAFGENDITPGF